MRLIVSYFFVWIRRSELLAEVEMWWETEKYKFEQVLNTNNNTILPQL